VVRTQFDTSDLLYVYLDRKKRRRKFLTTTFFRALSNIEKGEKDKDKDKDKDVEKGSDERDLEAVL